MLLGPTIRLRRRLLLLRRPLSLRLESPLERAKIALERRVVVIPKSANPRRIASNVHEPWSFALTAEERTALDALEDGGRFCTAPWSTFDDKTAGSKALEGVLTLLARGIFSVASLDITK